MIKFTDEWRKENTVDSVYHFTIFLVRNIIQIGGTMSTIEFYETTDGKSPIKDFFESISDKDFAIVSRDLSLLELKGHFIREPKSKIVDRKEKIFELRSKFPSGISRIFYFFMIGDKIIITNGYIKKTTKTSKKEIEKAIKFKHEYERRVHDDSAGLY